MGRRTGPSCKICRREGEKLFLKGYRCQTDKCAVTKKTYPPGEHGKRRRRESDFAVQLREKQKVKEIYSIRESQFRNYFKEADRSKGVTGEVLLSFLERRLDNVIYRMCFSTSRVHARQIVNHGHVFVNSKRINISSYRVNFQDEIEIRLPKENVKNLKSRLEKIDRKIPDWITIDEKKFKGIINRLPHREDIGFSVREQLIVEYYSK